MKLNLRLVPGARSGGKVLACHALDMFSRQVQRAPVCHISTHCWRLHRHSFKVLKSHQQMVAEIRADNRRPATDACY